MEELDIRNWRVTQALPSGLHVFFDPTRECVKLFRLSPAEQPQLSSEAIWERLVPVGESGYLDRVLSMRASETEAEPVQLDLEDALSPEDEELPF